MALGLGLGAAIAVVPTTLGNPSLNRGQPAYTTAYAVAGAVSLAGIAGFITGHRIKPMPENMRRNQELRERDALQRQSIAATNARARERSAARGGRGSRSVSARGSVRVALAAAAAVCLSAGRAHAQRLAGSGGGYTVQYRVSYQGTVYEQTGTWFGASGSVRLGRLDLGLSGLMGSLAGDSAAAPGQDVRSTLVTLRLAVAPWAEIGAAAEGRRFTSDAGERSWRLIGGNARFTPPLGLTGLEAVAELSYFPSATISGGGTMSLAMQATLGAGYVAARGPLTATLAYRFERYDFKAEGASPARLEQFQGVLATVGLKLGR